jgi:NADH-quinone oxidoreductase subunit E
MKEEILENYNSTDKSNLIPLLQDVQNHYGYLPEKILKEISEFISIPLSRIYGVATFYNQFRLTPLGENVIRVCRGTACHVKNSSNILYALETELKIKAGETTKDKKFTLEVVNCIGACSIAPVITVDEEYFGRIAIKDVPGIVKKNKKLSKPKELEPGKGGLSKDEKLY